MNGHLVIEKGMDGELIVCDGGYKYLFTCSIHSIVTKEQFAQAEYKIEEDK